METQGRPSIRFVLNGHRYELARDDVERRLVEVAPDIIRKHAVRVSGIWFPVIQAFEVVTGIPRSESMSHTARRHFAALGYEVVGDVEPRTGALPDFPHYRDLHAETAASLAAAQIEIWWFTRPAPWTGHVSMASRNCPVADMKTAREVGRASRRCTHR